jgi:hypothetical protein
MKLKREHNFTVSKWDFASFHDDFLDQEREDRRRINELMSMNDNIENNSLMGNFKDCRPADF